MDPTLATVVVVALFALIIIAAFYVFQRRGRVRINTPLGGLEVNGSNEPDAPSPAVTVEDVESSDGSILADDQTGRGASVRKAKVKGDILASSTTPDRDDQPKKAPPPQS